MGCKVEIWLYMDMPFGYAVASKSVTFILGMSSGSKPLKHWQSDLVAAAAREKQAMSPGREGRFIIIAAPL